MTSSEIPGEEWKRAEVGPLRRLERHLLAQLAPRGHLGLLPRHVEQPGGELDELLAGRVAVLPQQADLPVVVDREDDHRPRVLQHQPPERLALRVVGAAYPVGAEREHPVVAEQVLAGLDRPPAVPVLERGVRGVRPGRYGPRVRP